MTQAAIADKLIRVNMSDQTVRIDDYPEDWKMLGGRGLSARILLTECDPACDPLGPDNMLVLAPGVMTGTSAPTSGRLSVGCKSPLTNGIKEANTGGDAGQHLMRLGYRAIIVTGQPANRDARWGLVVNASGVSLQTADAYKGMWNYASCEKLLTNFPKTASAISIGPAGELMLKGASVATTDSSKFRRPARQAARGGVGAVMGSKCLKWIVVDPGKLPSRQAGNPKAFNSFNKSFSKAYLSGKRYEMFKYGTSAAVPLANMLNTLPYKNRTEGQNPEVDGLDGAHIRETFEERGGGMHNCMAGCIVQCSNIVHDKQGQYLTSALEFETLALLGSSCDINSWEDVAELDRLCDELGLDTIETGAALAVLMDSDGLPWGDAEAAKSLLRAIDQQNETTLDVGNGAAHVGRKRNHKRVPGAKGQAIPAWDPRPLKSAGITYCTSAMGADHTAGFVIVPGQSDEDAMLASQETQIINAVVDSSGFCVFLAPSLDEVRQFYGNLFDREVSREEIADIGWQCLTDEWAFNDKAGFTAADDVLADCLVKEGIGPDHTLVFDVAPEIIARTKVRQAPRESLFAEPPEI
jgi:aldehyde:ferredoxin oxidoreductase